MKQSFIERLGTGEPMVADGATGTNLQAKGLPPGTPPETWVMDRPEALVELHRAFVDAGSDIILTCSFGGNRYRLRDSKYHGQVREINVRAAGLARQAASESSRNVFVGGSIGPTGLMLEPFGPLTENEVADAFAEQAAALTEGKVDVLVVETFFALEEARAAIDGIRQASNLPIICSFSFDRATRTMMGVRPAQMAETVIPMGVVAVGANCGTTLENMEKIVQELVEHSAGLPVWAKPNAGQPEGTPARYPVGPEEMGNYARRFIEAGARIVGGCCGNTPDHVRAIASAVSTHRKPAEAGQQ